MTELQHPLLADYPLITRIAVQWGDQDALGHVNNTIYIRWFETVRVDYLEHVELTHVNYEEEIGPILVAVHCNYRQQLNYPDHVLTATRVEKMGHTSMTMQHAIVSETQNKIVADGQSVIVTYDYQKKKTVEVPEALRQAIEKFEGKTF